MSLSSALNAARSGLQVSGLRAETVASNVANASTAGYVRRSVSISEVIVGSQSAGVKSDGITRAADTAIKAQRREVGSDLAQSELLAATWRTLSARVGDTADGRGLFGAFAGFEAALSRAALSPESTAEAAALLDSAMAVATELNGLSRLTQELRIEADRDIAEGVTVVNRALRQIEDLNRRLAGIDRTTAQAAGLMDERQRVIDTISDFLPVVSVARDSGTIDLLTREGVYLVAGKARQISFTPTSAFGPGDLMGGGLLSGMSVDGVELTPGSTSFGAVSSGRFGALFSLRDRELPQLSAQLDAIAADLIARLSDDALDPTKPPGAPGLFLDPAAASGAGLAARITINPAIDPSQGGALWRLRDGLGAAAPGHPGNRSILDALSTAIRDVRTISGPGLSGAFSATGLAARFASIAGQARISQESVLAATRSQHASLVEAEQSLTGVDIDTQMQELLLIEQAYAANARVIEVTGQMMRLLMEL